MTVSESAVHTQQAAQQQQEGGEATPRGVLHVDMQRLQVSCSLQREPEPLACRAIRCTRGLL
jgi:hypothetical protein